MMKNNPESLTKVEALKPKLKTLLVSYMGEMNDRELRDDVEADYKDLLGAESILDFSVQCDGLNNTAERIENNELWVDIAVRYADDEMYIYIPLRLTKEGIHA